MSTVIAVTGGSCSGKTTFAEAAASHYPDLFWVAREAARVLIEQQRIDQTTLTAEGRRQLQLQIFALQRKLEGSAPTGKIILADRATIDGAAYWPGGPDDFWLATGSRHDQELSRYHGAIWLESAAAVGNYSPNSVRPESGEESLDLGTKIQALWMKHPRLYIITAAANFSDKASAFYRALFALAGPLVDFSPLL